MADRLKQSLILCLGVLIIDQAVKFAVLRLPSFQILPFLHIQVVHNTGAAFGLLKGQNDLLLYLGVILFGLGLFMHEKLLTHWWAYGFIGAGVLGNTADRLIYGFVIDYFSFSFWPAFNIADVALCIGVGALILKGFLQKS
jgi:signal peptidase II